MGPVEAHITAHFTAEVAQAGDVVLRALLGDHHDSVVARAVLLDLATTARAGGQDTFSYGQMYQSQVCQVAAIEQSLPRIATAAIATTARSRGFVSHQS